MSGPLERPAFALPHDAPDRFGLLLLAPQSHSIDRCSRRIAPALEKAGFSVVDQEFDGPHTVPPHIAAQSADWLLAY